MRWTWSIERWRKTSCGPAHDVLMGTHDVLMGTYDVLAGTYDVLAGDCPIGDIFGEQSEPIDIRSARFCSHF